MGPERKSSKGLYIVILAIIAIIGIYYVFFYEPTYTIEGGSEEEIEALNENKIYDKGLEHFESLDWESVFQYGITINYDEYQCATTTEEGKEYGVYAAVVPAYVTNMFGAQFKTNIFIFMNDEGDISRIFYDDPENGTTEVPYEGSNSNAK